MFSGQLFPFLFITIACGAVSGFHSLISSGTTPKMIEKESHARFIGFGGMLAESFVAVMALTAACVLDPGIYFAMNAPAAVIGTTAAQAAQVISGWGFTITPELIEQTARDIGETSILSRAGGAPTLAVGMAQILGAALGGKAMEAFWYHFAILFEALFILTAVDAGTRVGRFMIQDMLGHVYRPLGNTEYLPANVFGTALCVGLWGYFLYQGVVDPLGGINTLWQLFGVGNQMLAGIALLLCTSMLVKMKRERYVWVTLVPTAWLLITTLTAGVQKIFSDNPAIGFIALARKFGDAAAQGKLLAPAKSIEEMQRVAFNNYLDAAVCAFFVLLVVAMCVFAAKICLQALRQAYPTAQEIPPQALAGRVGSMSAQRDATRRRGRAGAALARPLLGLPPGVRHAGLRTLPRARRVAPPRRAGADARRVLRPRDRAQVRAGRHALLLTRRRGRGERASRGLYSWWPLVPKACEVYRSPCIT